MHIDQSAVAPAPWGVLAASLFLFIGVTEWMNRNIPVPSVSTVLRWLRAQFRPLMWIDFVLRLAGRAIDFARALGYCLADVVPAAWARGRDRWPEYLMRVYRER